MPAIRIARGFRRRLTVAFILIVAISGGILALTSFVLIREYRTRSFTAQARDKAALSLISAPADLTVAKVDQLLVEYHDRGGFETVVIANDVVFSSTASLGKDAVPERMRSIVQPGALEQQDVRIAGEPMLVIGSSTPNASARMFFFFSKVDLLDSITTFRNVLVLSWTTSVLAAALFGNLVARRTLRPVNDAAAASQALAEGLLDTRLESDTDDEFGKWASSFNTMAEALEEKIGALSRAAERERRFTADVAHELRTPLTGMVAAASLLEEELPELGPGAGPPARLLTEDVRRLQVLVAELLELARFDAGQEQARLERLSLGEALRTVTRSWDGSAPVHLDVDDDVSVLADRARFKRVVANLLSNARTHGGDGVEVRGYRDGDRAVVEVHDRGPGIDERDLERVFDRFFKGDHSRSSGGSGLGLAIALENARLQGGHLSAHNLDTGGACFTFTLRVASTTSSNEHGRPTGDPVLRAPEPTHGKGTDAGTAELHHEMPPAG